MKNKCNLVLNLKIYVFPLLVLFISFDVTSKELNNLIVPKNFNIEILQKESILQDK